jgi:nucleoside-diphosphate-sugar epimerase
VIDTWSGASIVVAHSSRLLSEHVAHYGYVSSASVYRWPMPAGADETAPTVDADPEGTADEDYAVSKRGAELAVLSHFPDRALLARAGLILGPYEDVGRLPWWLRRLARGGRVVAPGPQDRPLQLIDARDLAGWMLSGADRGLAGAFNTVSRPGHTTMGELLTVAAHVVGGAAELVWVSPQTIAAAGVSAWTELPIWMPPSGELAALHDVDVAAALERGLSCRPIAATVADTWDWLQREGPSTRTHPRAAVGLDVAGEQRILALLPEG